MSPGCPTALAPKFSEKDMQLLREIVPGLRYVAVLSNPTGPNHARMLSNVNIAARTLGLDILLLEASGPSEFDGAFAAMTKEHVGALFVYGDPMFGIHRARLAELAKRNRLASDAYTP